MYICKHCGQRKSWYIEHDKYTNHRQTKGIIYTYPCMPEISARVCYDCVLKNDKRDHDLPIMFKLQKQNIFT
jgi:hypothetical protein